MAGAAYIISAYKRPDILFRLVSALGDAPTAIHVDMRSPIFGEVRDRLGRLEHIELLPRHVCKWGRFGHVRASLKGLRWFQRTSCSHAILLTGQCYPLRPKTELDRSLAELGERSRIRTQPFPLPQWANERGGFDRVERIYYQIWGSETMRHFRRIRRRVPYGLYPWGGGGYWCMSRKHADYVLDTVDRRPGLSRFFSRTLIPDETFFHTILGNSPFAEDVVSERTHFIKWGQISPSPVTLDESHLSEAFASDAWFARKFDDEKVLYAIDRQLAAAGG